MEKNERSLVNPMVMEATARSMVRWTQERYGLGWNVEVQRAKKNEAPQLASQKQNRRHQLTFDLAADLTTSRTQIMPRVNLLLGSAVLAEQYDPLLVQTVLAPRWGNEKQEAIVSNMIDQASRARSIWALDIVEQKSGRETVERNVSMDIQEALEALRSKNRNFTSEDIVNVAICKAEVVRYNLSSEYEKQISELFDGLSKDQLELAAKLALLYGNMPQPEGSRDQMLDTFETVTRISSLLLFGPDRVPVIREELGTAYWDIMEPGMS